MQSVFHISYLRGLFPDDHFKGVDMKNLDNMHIKMLNATCPEARQLIDWVEGGMLTIGIGTPRTGQQLDVSYALYPCDPVP
jgi:hypothetical protein